MQPNITKQEHTLNSSIASNVTDNNEALKTSERQESNMVTNKALSQENNTITNPYA